MSASPDRPSPNPARRAPPTAPLVVIPEPELDADGRLAEEVLCRACGHNLRGTLPTLDCPECGIPIAHSIRGDLLRYCDPGWVRRLRLGTSWTLVGILAAILVGFAGTIARSVFFTSSFSSPGAAIAVSTTIGVSASLVFVIGVWLLTTPDPGAQREEERIFSWRRVARWGVMSQFVVAPLEMLTRAGGSLSFAQIAGMPTFGASGLSVPLMQLVMGVAVLGGLVVLVGKFATLFYLATLALRMPRRDLVRQSRFVAWGYALSHSLALLVSVFMLFALPAMMAAAAGGGAAAGTGPTASYSFIASSWMVVFAVGGCVSGLAALIFGVWAIVLLFVYGGAFRKMENAAQASWRTVERRQTD